MNKSKQIINLCEIEPIHGKKATFGTPIIYAPHIPKVLTEIDRRKDYKGNRIGGTIEYVLRHKRFKTYVGEGGLHGTLTPRLIDAEAFPGFSLTDMAYDWTLDFQAVPYEDEAYTGTGSTGGRFP